MRQNIVWVILCLCATGCSSLAYIKGYNFVSDQKIEVTRERPSESSEFCPACGEAVEGDIKSEQFKCPACGYTNASYSETAYVIAMVETGGGYLRKSPTLVLGIALAPVFFIVGTVSGAFDPGEPPERIEPVPERIEPAPERIEPAPVPERIEPAPERIEPSHPAVQREERLVFQGAK